jgi:ATP-dependent Clp protease protease subunit
MNHKLLKNACTPRKWYNLEESGDEATMYIYDMIGVNWWGEGLDPKSFIDDITKSKAKRLNIHINSPGGFIYDGFAIYNFLANSEKHIVAHVDAVAASTAGWIFQAADERIMHESSQLMLHDPSTYMAGNAEDLRREADELDRMKKQIADIFAKRSKQKPEKIEEIMSNITYMTGKEALELGLTDKVVENKHAMNIAFDLSLLPNPPESLVKTQNAERKRNLEDALRDAGYSRAEAKRLAAGPRRDADEGCENELANSIRENIKRIQELTKEK